jgi:ABC-2 type transport system permease protein
MLPLWAYALIGSAAATAYSIKGLYSTPASRQDLVNDITAAPAAAALYGKIYVCCSRRSAPACCWSRPASGPG